MNLLGSLNMKKIKFNTFVLAIFLAVSFSAKAIPTPEAVEQQYDDDGNPMYYVAYGKGDRKAIEFNPDLLSRQSG